MLVDAVVPVGGGVDDDDPKDGKYAGYEIRASYM